MNMQSVCDHHPQIIIVLIVTSGSSSDSMAYQPSSLYEFMEHKSRSLSDGILIAGDIAYICSSPLLTTWTGQKVPNPRLF